MLAKIIDSRQKGDRAVMDMKNEATDLDGRRTITSIIDASPKDRIQEFVDSAGPLADKIIRTLGLSEGILLDSGCGGAYIDVALSKVSGLEFILLDPALKATDSAKANMEIFGLSDRFRVIRSDEEIIPLEDETVDYVISTISIGHWHNKQQGLEEIHRVLKVGGRAYITGIEWDSYRDYFGMLKQAGLEKFAINNDGDDMWIDLFKVAPAEEEK